MFTRAGKPKEDNGLSEAFTQAAVANHQPFLLVYFRTSGTGASPAKIIEAQSKCYKQLHDLSSLKELGVLTSEEYSDEKDAALRVLKNLKGV